MLGAVRGNPGSGGQHDLLQGRVGQELRRHGRQALRQDGAVHGGGDQVQIAASQHAAGESDGRESGSGAAVEKMPVLLQAFLISSFRQYLDKTYQNICIHFVFMFKKFKNLFRYRP